MGSCRRVQGVRTSSSHTGQPATIGDQSVRVNDDGRDSRSTPALAVDRQGNAYAAWVDYRDGIAAIYAATRPADGKWGRNTRVSGGAANGYTGLAIIVDWDDNGPRVLGGAGSLRGRGEHGW